MNKKKSLSCEIARIIMAEELDIPPDDIDMSSIIICCERAVEDVCEGKNKEYIISIENKKEEEAILGKYGHQIVERFFTHRSPFYDWVDKYETYYKSKEKNKRKR